MARDVNKRAKKGEAVQCLIIVYSALQLQVATTMSQLLYKLSLMVLSNCSNLSAQYKVRIFSLHSGVYVNNFYDIFYIKFIQRH